MSVHIQLLQRLKIPESFIDVLLRLSSISALLFLSYVSVLIIYRLWFHPLAKYPGPLLGKLTNGYAFYYTWKRKSHLKVHELHQKYGKFVRFRPDGLLINDNEAIKQIYGYKANVQNSNTFATWSPTLESANTHAMINKRLHARKRRVLAHCFSDATLKALSGHVTDGVNVFNRVIRPKDEEWSEPQDMSVQCNSLTFDVMGAVTFSKSYGMLENNENLWIQDALLGSSQHKFMFGLLQPLYKLGLDASLFRGLSKLRDKYDVYAANQMRERIDSKGDKLDFVSFMLESKDPQTGQGFQFPELVQEAHLLIGAGSDTTSTALAAAFYFMTHRLEELTELTKEIRSTFSSIEEIVIGPELAGCRYLRAFIDESMRLVPPVPGMLWREVLPGGLDTAGETIPAGTDVAVSAYTVMRNPEYYPEPDKFNPQRWLVDSDEPLKIAHSAFCPFSIGPRACIGRSLAYQELTLTIARTLWQHDVRLLPGSTRGDGPDGNFVIEDCFIAKKAGPLAQFRVREQ